MINKYIRLINYSIILVLFSSCTKTIIYDYTNLPSNKIPTNNTEKNTLNKDNNLRNNEDKNVNSNLESKPKTETSDKNIPSSDNNFTENKNINDNSENNLQNNDKSIGYFDKYLDNFSYLGKSVLNRLNNEQLTKPSNSTVDYDSIVTLNNRFIKTYVNGYEIFNGMKDIISKAKNEVVFVTFFWESDSDPVRTIGEALKIAEKNISNGNKLKVRFMINDFQLDLNKNVNALHDAKKAWNLDENKIELQFSVYPHFSLGALHSKYLVVDGRYVIITGANAQNKNNFNSSAWHDTGYLLEGDLAKSVLNDFDEAWNNHAIHWDCKVRAFSQDCIKTNKPLIGDRNNFLPKNVNFGLLPVITLAKQGNGQLNDLDNNPQNQGWISVMETAKKNINIQSPNINDDSFQDSVINALKRGVKIKLNTGIDFNDSREDLPSQGGTNKEVVNNFKNRILNEAGEFKNNFEVKWYSKDGISPATDKVNLSHIKFMSVDGQVVIIGSGNMDTQSWNQSREFNILIDDPNIVKQIEDDFFIEDWEKGISVD